MFAGDVKCVRECVGGEGEEGEAAEVAVAAAAAAEGRRLSSLPQRTPHVSSEPCVAEGRARHSPLCPSFPALRRPAEPRA